jgi:hypothetical protein
MLQSWKEQIQMCLNIREIPKLLNFCIISVAFIIEQASIIADPITNARGLQIKVKEAIDVRKFNKEITQLSIELAYYFALGPKCV